MYANVYIYIPICKREHPQQVKVTNFLDLCYVWTRSCSETGSLIAGTALVFQPALRSYHCCAAVNTGLPNDKWETTDLKDQSSCMQKSPLPIYNSLCSAFSKVNHDCVHISTMHENYFWSWIHFKHAFNRFGILDEEHDCVCRELILSSILLLFNL